MNLFEQIITLLFHVGRLMIIYCLSYFKLTMKFTQNIRVLKASLVYFFNILVPIVCAAICSKVIFRLGLLKTTDKNYSTMKPTMDGCFAFNTMSFHLYQRKIQTKLLPSSSSRVSFYSSRCTSIRKVDYIVMMRMKTYIRIYYL